MLSNPLLNVTNMSANLTGAGGWPCSVCDQPLGSAYAALIQFFVLCAECIYLCLNLNLVFGNDPFVAINTLIREY